MNSRKRKRTREGTEIPEDRIEYNITVEELILHSSHKTCINEYHSIMSDTEIAVQERMLHSKNEITSIISNSGLQFTEDTSETQLALQERVLDRRRQIQSIMSNAGSLLKDVLLTFVSEVMLEAYGSAWVGFPTEADSLKCVFECILKYWRLVFHEYISERDKKNIELLLEKSIHPEDFANDKDDCLVILLAVEDLFRQIQKKRPKLTIPVELILEYRAACVNAFTAYNEAESESRPTEDKNVREVLDDSWSAINYVCGIIMDHYGIPHNFEYSRKDKKYSDFEIRCLMVIAYPDIQRIKRLLCRAFNAVKNYHPTKKITETLAAALLEFIPSLKLPNESKPYPSFNATALEKWFTSPQNRQTIEIGIMQIERYFSKLEEALRVIEKKSPDLIDSI